MVSHSNLPACAPVHLQLKRGEAAVTKALADMGLGGPEVRGHSMIQSINHCFVKISHPKPEGAVQADARDSWLNVVSPAVKQVTIQKVKQPATIVLEAWSIGLHPVAETVRQKGSSTQDTCLKDSSVHALGA
jgi:hypothetical protein